MEYLSSIVFHTVRVAYNYINRTVWNTIDDTYSNFVFYIVTKPSSIGPSANKDSNCWGQDISSSYSKSIKNTRLSLCFFKTMASKENMLKIT